MASLLVDQAKAWFGLLAICNVSSTTIKVENIYKNQGDRMTKKDVESLSPTELYAELRQFNLKMSLRAERVRAEKAEQWARIGRKMK